MHGARLMRRRRRSFIGTSQSEFRLHPGGCAAYTHTRGKARSAQGGRCEATGAATAYTRGHPTKAQEVAVEPPVNRRGAALAPEHVVQQTSRRAQGRGARARDVGAETHMDRGVPQATRYYAVREDAGSVWELVTIECGSSMARGSFWRRRTSPRRCRRARARSSCRGVLGALLPRRRAAGWGLLATSREVTCRSRRLRAPLGEDGGKV